jgi:hypothetical protein
VKLYVDADITPRLARILRERGYDVLSAHEAGMADAPDSEQMAFAVVQERALLTCNAGDFTSLFEEYWDVKREHFGVIVSAQLELGEMIRRVTRLLDAISADELHSGWKNLAEYAS